MKKLFSLLVVLLFLSLSFKTYGQVNTYTFIQSSGAYTPITGSIIDTASSSAGATSLDDVAYSTRAIGFSFSLNSIAYTTYNMNTNGQITFGATSPGTTNYTPISGTIAYASCIAGMARDLQGIYGFTATRTLASTTLTGVTNFAGIVIGKVIAGTGIAVGTRVTAINTGAGTVDISIAATAAGTTTLNCCSGELRSETQGVAGSMVHIIQWSNFKRFGSTALLDNFNFQIRIYETSNIIEVVYGSVIANATAIVPQIGLRGATNADFNNRLTTTDWSATTAGGVNTATVTLSSTVFPISGQTYRWTPLVNTNDVGTTVIVNPVNGGASGNQAPVATIKNFGSANQSGYNVTCTISPGGYTDTQVAPLLTSGSTANINFANVVLSPAVAYTVTVYTSLAGDQVLTNDTQRVNATLIYTTDVGTTVILNPTNGGGSGNQLPVATIKNFGSANQSGFNITCTISPGGYSDSQLAPLLTSSNTANINFSNFNFIPNVAYTVTVYTSLVGDQNLLNDTQRVTTTLINTNYGADSGYFFANNLATDLGSFPEYCWKDTTGSKSVLVNGVTSPGNTLVGSVDDGYYKLSLKNILLSLGQDTTDRHLKYNGVCYDSIFPGSNGIIGFTEAFGTISISDFNIDGAQVAKYALLPIWHDFDLGTLTFQTNNRLSYLAKGNQLIITYDKVAAFAPENNWTSFQVVIEIVTGCAAPNSNFRYTFADTTGGKTSAAFLADYIAQYPAANGATTIFRNYLSGFSNTGAPIVYAGFVSSGNLFPASPQTIVNIKRPLFNLTSGKGLAVEFGPNVNILNEHDCLTLCVALSLQGPQSNPSPRVRDTVEITLRDASVAPYKVYQKFTVLLDSAYNNTGLYSYGVKYIEYSLLKKNTPYYIQIKNRNSITSWSTIASTNSDTLKYDFTTGLSQTFGNNAKLVNGAASFYTGDVDSLRDGTIDLTDIIQVYNASNTFTNGPYVLTDLNWDETVDLTDVVLVYNNASTFVGVVAPPGAVSLFEPQTEVFNYNYKNNDAVIILPDPYQQPKIDINATDYKEDSK